MKNLILILSVLLITQRAHLNAEEPNNDKETQQSYGYYSFSGGFPSIFTFGLGQRMQYAYHGLDAGVRIAPLVFAVGAHGYFNYLYFPKPKLDSQIYMGLGAQSGGAMCVSHLKRRRWRKGIGFIKPQLIFGKEYMLNTHEKRFIEAELGAVYFSTKKTKFIPSLMITYGIRF